MLLRFLLGMLAPGQTIQRNDSETLITPETAEAWDIIKLDYQNPAKFHVGMLSISLITGLAFGGFVVYTCWMEKDTFLGYIRNLVIALVFRTFFSVLFDGVILLGSITDWGGGNTLMAFEQISMNLVFAFWLTLTIYSHARVQREFNSEPTMRLYEYGVPGVAVLFAFIWIFTLQDQVPNVLWWFTLHPFTLWIVNSINLVFLLVQLGLVADIVRMMMIKKQSLDNDSVSLLWRVGAILGVLVLIFWLEFGVVIGRIPLTTSAPFLNFHSFIDGSECGLVCLCLYFYHKWVPTLFNKSFLSEQPPPTTTEPTHEVLLPGKGDRGIVTIDSVFMTRESGSWKNPNDDAKDVVYSNVLDPERLKKTLELYKRFNVYSKPPATVVEGDEFYDCRMLSSLEYETESEKNPQQHQPEDSVLNEETIKLKKDKICEQTQKKNAFYASKYLILDPKEKDFPKYLETRPSVSSLSEKDSPKEESINRTDLSSGPHLKGNELVRKWLDDYSEIQKKYNKKYRRKAESGTDDANRHKEPDDSIPKILLNADLGSNTPENLEQTKSIIPDEETPPDNTECLFTTTSEQTPEEVNKKDSSPEFTKIVVNTIESILNEADVPEKFIPPPVETEHKEYRETETEQQTPHEVVDNEKPETTTPKSIETPSNNLNQCISYSELLEFRSRRDKMAPEKPIKYTSNFSESIFATFDSLLNAGGSFLASIKPVFDEGPKIGPERITEECSVLEKSECVNDKLKEPKINPTVDDNLSETKDMTTENGGAVNDQFEISESRKETEKDELKPVALSIPEEKLTMDERPYIHTKNESVNEEKLQNLDNQPKLQNSTENLKEVDSTKQKLDEYSPESGFGAEKESFSLEQYYTSLMTANNIINPSNSIRQYQKPKIWFRN